MRYADLAALYAFLEETSKRLEKTWLIAQFLKKVPAKQLDKVILLLQGRVFPLWDKRVLGLSEKLIIKAISTASGASEKRILDEWRKVGDIGLVAEALVAKKTQATLFSEELTVQQVFGNLQRVAASEGSGSTGVKVKLVAQLLSSAEGPEARYVVRSVIGDLRVGIAEGTLRDAVLWAYLVPEASYDVEKNALVGVVPEGAALAVQSALDRSNDFALVARMAREKGVKGLREVRMVPGKPLKVMLAQKVLSAEVGLGRVGSPCAVEYKYDGFRMQVHKADGVVRLFTRRLEEVTEQFPDVVEAVGGIKGESFIFDAEAVGFDPKTGKYRPFQEISQRIRRKYEIQKLAKALPVELNVFDVLFFDGEEYIDRPFSERRAFLESHVNQVERSLVLSRFERVESVPAVEAFYQESLAAGNEGIMFKKFDAPYRPGSRVGTMIKLKPTLDTFDLVIVGAEWGTGKRSGWLTSFTVACRDDVSGEFLELGRFGTGVKEKVETKGEGDVTFEELTGRLRPLVTSAEGRDVVLRPGLVVEVKFEEVQRSPTYASGFALRFPRFVCLRDDRGAEGVTSLAAVELVYEHQRNRN